MIHIFIFNLIIKKVKDNFFVFIKLRKVKLNKDIYAEATCFDFSTVECRMTVCATQMWQMKTLILYEKWFFTRADQERFLNH